MPSYTTPWSTVGFLTFVRTYSRKKADGTQESFEDTIERCLTACDTQLGVGLTPEEREDFKRLLMELKCSFAGRFLWQLGTKTVEKHGLMSLQNCAFVVVDQPIRPFTWAMDSLMLGCGIGFNIQHKNVRKLPKVVDEFRTPQRQDNASADFIVPDTREGWVRLLGKTLKSAFLSTKTKPSFTYSTQLIRGKGAPIQGFGGVASGPEILVEGLNKIGRILENRRGRKVRPIDCLDIMNIIASIVVAGNIRRSALIALGDASDTYYIESKSWGLGNIPNWRDTSNNSVICEDITDLPESFWQGYKGGSGEPFGLINLESSRKYGRSGDTRYPDPDVQGYNPCAEISLDNHETCALAEIFLPNVSSKQELSTCAKYLYRAVKHSLALNCHHPETEAIVHKNMRMGIGITGYLQASEEKRSWLSDVYEELRAYDREYSTLKGWPESKKLTTCKPSGTLSLLPGVTPGVHPGFASYMIRRIRFSSDSPLIPLILDHGYPVEYAQQFDGSNDYATMVVSFPLSYPEGTPVADSLTAIQQLEYVRRLQREWSDNAVSVTCYFREEELPDIRAYLAEHWQEFKTVSFLKHRDHGFKQAPYEEISKERYDELVAKTRVIDSLAGVSASADDGPDYSGECAGGSCPIR